MADTPEHEPDPAEPVSDSAADTGAETDVERVLADAAAYGAELGQEIGQAATPSTMHLDLDPITAGTQGMDPERELDRLEELLANVAEDEPGEPAGGPPPSRKAGRVTEYATDPATRGPTPDDHLKGPAGLPSAATVDTTAGPGEAGEEIQWQSPNVFDGEFMADLDKGPAPLGQGHTADDASLAHDSLSQKQRQPVLQERAPGLPNRKQLGWGALTAPFRTIVYGAAETVLEVLDRFDRMFVWVNADLRRIVGWAALAITILAVAILIHSFS